MKDTVDPAAPDLIKSTSAQDFDRVVPVDRVKGFAEANLEDDRGGLARMAAPDEIRSIDYVFGYAATKKETRLVAVHQRVNSTLPTSGKSFSNAFHNTVLEGDGAEVRRVRRGGEFWNQDKVGSVYTG